MDSNNAVGKNLQDHLMLRPVYRIKNLETLNEVYHNLFKKMVTGINYFVVQKGTPEQWGLVICVDLLKAMNTWKRQIYNYHVSPMSTDILG